MVAMLTNIEARMLKKDEDATVEALAYSPATLASPVTLTPTPIVTPSLTPTLKPTLSP